MKVLEQILSAHNNGSELLAKVNPFILIGVSIGGTWLVLHIQKTWKESNLSFAEFCLSRFRRQRPIQRVRSIAQLSKDLPIDVGYVPGKNNNTPVRILVDCGTVFSFISECFAKKCGLGNDINRNIKIESVGVGGGSKMIGRIPREKCNVQIGTHKFPCGLDVARNEQMDWLGGEDFILGQDIIIPQKVDLDFENLRFHFGGRINQTIPMTLGKDQ